MDESLNIREQLTLLQRELNELSSKQAEAIANLRGKIVSLELRMNQSAEAQPAIAVEELPKADVKPVTQPPPLPRSFYDVHKQRADRDQVAAGNSSGTKDNKQQPVVESVQPVMEKLRKPVSRSFEVDLGRVWLVRIGIVLLVTGLVLLGNYAYRNWIQDLSSGIRLTFLFVTSLLVSGAGWWCALKEKTRTFGEVILAGGMAYFYWCAYASYHVDQLRVIDSPVVSTIVLLIAAASIVGVSIYRNSRITAVMGLLLAAYSTILQPMQPLSALSNVMLAIAGVGLMSWKRWNGPGLAAVISSYGAFFYWVLFDARGEGFQSWSLCFPVILAVAFTIPTLLPKGLPDLSRYARAWWTGVNNIIPFGLFSLGWWRLGWGDYWLVPCWWGVAWMLLGIGLRRRSISSETYLVQGLSALTVALILKLEGYSLAMGLGMEAMIMAGAFYKFRKWPELTFSLIATAGSLFFLFFTEAPMYSMALAAAMAAGASVVLHMTKAKTEAHRIIIGIQTIFAGLVSFVLWFNLEPEIQAWAAQIPAIGLAYIAIKPERRKDMPYVFFLSLLFAGATIYTLFMGDSSTLGLWITAGLAGLGAWLWEKHGQPVGLGKNDDVNKVASIATWVSALTLPLALVMVFNRQYEFIHRYTLEIAFALALPIIAARAIKCQRLRLATSLLLVVAFLDLLISSGNTSLLSFLCAFVAWIVWYIARDASYGDRVHQVLTRTIGTAAWIHAWHSLEPNYWGDALAISTLAGWFILRKLKKTERYPLEFWAWGGCSLLAFAAMFLIGGLNDGGSIPSGWGLFIAMTCLTFLHKRNVSAKWDKGIAIGMVIITAIWSSVWLTHSHGWTAMALLWTFLGFAYVSLGLLTRYAALRIGGFVLLAIALMKLFINDIWDYDAFIRVIAFILLGVALVVLGFFYNHFTSLMKKLIHDDEKNGTSTSEEE